MIKINKMRMDGFEEFENAHQVDTVDILETIPPMLDTQSKKFGACHQHFAILYYKAALSLCNNI